MNIFSRLFKTEKKIGCPNCYKKEIVSFGKDLLDNKFISEIYLESKISSIDIFKCKKCETNFHISQNMYEKILPGQIEILKNWNEKSLVCPENLKNEIEKIGFSEDWNLGKVLPSKIELKNGEKYEKTIIKFTSIPPIGYFNNEFKNIFFIDDVESIEKSEFGLSKEIRIESLNAEERRMGFNPTVLRNKNDIKVVINGISLFFNSENIKGSELELANETWDHKKKYIYDNYNQKEITLVIAKK